MRPPGLAAPNERYRGFQLLPCDPARAWERDAMTRPIPLSVSLTVVISTLDRPAQLARCLDALLAGTCMPAEIVVVDQGDTSITAQIISARPARGVEVVHVPH